MSAEHTAIMDRLQSTEQRLKAEISRQISILHDLKKDQVSMVSHCSMCVCVRVCVRGGLYLTLYSRFRVCVANHRPSLLRIDQVSGPRG